MTPRQRFAAVFRGEVPDRVPVTLFIQDQGHFVSQLHPELDPWDSLTIQLRIVEFQKSSGPTSWRVSCSGRWIPSNGCSWAAWT